jgi:hypothetical protein
MRSSRLWECAGDAFKTASMASKGMKGNGNGSKAAQSAQTVDRASPFVPHFVPMKTGHCPACPKIVTHVFVDTIAVG